MMRKLVIGIILLIVAIQSALIMEKEINAPKPKFLNTERDYYELAEIEASYCEHLTNYSYDVAIKEAKENNLLCDF